jgi:hypothetical protein
LIDVGLQAVAIAGGEHTARRMGVLGIVNVGLARRGAPS